MQNIQVLILFVAVLFTVLRSCDGLQCQQCDTYSSTEEDPQCIDPYRFGDDYLDDCEDGDTHCAKMKTVATRVDTESGGLQRQIVITRLCRSLPERREDQFCDELVGASSFSITCYCLTEGCNSGPISRPTLGLITMTTFLSLFMPVFIQLLLLS